MALWKRGKQYWMDVIIRGQRYREPLDTTDWREANQLERDRVQQIETRGPVPTGSSKAYAALDVASAIEAYARERRAQVSCFRTSVSRKAMDSACFADSTDRRRW